MSSSATPVSGHATFAVMRSWKTMTAPLISNKAARIMRSQNAERRPPGERPSIGSATWRSSLCSSRVAFRQISTSPASATTGGQDSEPSQPTCSSEAIISTRVSSEAAPAASAMPRRSVSARLAILRSSPAAGMKSHKST
jgi:hypothetical protein